MDNTEQDITNLSQSVLIVSSDHEITDTIISNNNSGFDVQARASWEEFLGEPELLANNGITIFDIDGFANTQQSVKQLIKIKQDDPTQVLIAIGDKDELGEFLKSNTQALIYRAFTKPVNPSQVLLAFKHGMKMHEELVVRRDAGEDLTVVGPAENRATLDTISDSGKTNPILYIAAGVAALAIGGWLMFGGGEPEQAPVIVETPQIVEDDSLAQELGPDISQINNLNQLASTAVLDGRLISPAGQNALEYYNQVLEIDSYDNTAYEGRQLIAEKLRENYAGLLKTAKFDKAIETLEVLRDLQPLNAQNEEMTLALESQIEQHVNTVRSDGSAEEIAKTTAILTSIGPKIKNTSNLANALEAETKILATIDAALNSDTVLPSQDGNAYNLLSGAVKDNSISKANLQPRLLSLSEKILQMASASFKTDNFDDTSKLLNLVKPLKVNKKQVEIAEEKLKARQEEIALAAIEAETIIEEVAVEEAEPEPPARILPAKLLKRPPPNYPRAASQKNIEGWVELTFSIDVKGRPADIVILDSEPKNVFEKEAMRSVKKWRFEPAFNETTNEPVISTVSATKVRFQLN